MYDDIVKYIPYGRENAISRDDLAIKVGCSDRIMRDLISKARKLSSSIFKMVVDITDQQKMIWKMY